MVILNFKIGYLKIKQKKLRFLNYFEAKKNGVNSLLNGRQLRSIQADDAVS